MRAAIIKGMGFLFGAGEPEHRRLYYFSPADIDKYFLNSIWWQENSHKFPESSSWSNVYFNLRRIFKEVYDSMMKLRKTNSI